MAGNEIHRFAFIAVDDFGQPRSSDRRLIRSHCMRGKNRRRFPNPSTPAPINSKDERTQSAQARLNYSAEDRSPSSTLQTLPPSYVYRLNGLASKADSPDSLWLPLSRPSIPPSAFSLIKLAEKVDDHSRELLHKRKLSIEFW